MGLEILSHGLSHQQFANLLALVEPLRPLGKRTTEGTMGYVTNQYMHTFSRYENGYVRVVRTSPDTIAYAAIGYFRQRRARILRILVGSDPQQQYYRVITEDGHRYLVDPADSDRLAEGKEAEFCAIGAPVEEGEKP